MPGFKSLALGKHVYVCCEEQKGCLQLTLLLKEVCFAIFLLSVLNTAFFFADV